jgi:hypothetical protein
MIYSHSGDIGDTIYSLPTIRAFGGGHLRLFPTLYTGCRMTPERAHSIATLVMHQDYIFSCEYAEHPEGTNLDRWRNHYLHGQPLADMPLKAWRCRIRKAPHLSSSIVPRAVITTASHGSAY